MGLLDLLVKNHASLVASAFPTCELFEQLVLADKAYSLSYINPYGEVSPTLPMFG